MQRPLRPAIEHRQRMPVLADLGHAAEQARAYRGAVRARARWPGNSSITLPAYMTIDAVAEGRHEAAGRAR